MIFDQGSQIGKQHIDEKFLKNRNRSSTREFFHGKAAFQLFIFGFHRPAIKIKFLKHCLRDEWIEKIKEKQPEFRDEKLGRYKKEFDIPQYDAEILTESKHMADIFEETTAICGKPKKVSNWLMVETMRLLKEHSMEPEDISFSPANLAKLIGLTEDGTINSSVAKEVFEQVFEKNVDPESYVEEHGLKTVNDEGALEEVLKEVIAKNPKAIADYKGGKEKALGALVGQTMKAMKGKANPGMVNQKLREMLK